MAYIKVFVCIANSVTISVYECCIRTKDVDLDLVSKVVALDVEEKKKMIVRKSLAHVS